MYDNKKILPTIVILYALLAGYALHGGIGEASTTFSGKGALNEAANWDNGFPTNDNPGLIEETGHVWIGNALTDFAVRQTGGHVFAVGDQHLALRGGKAEGIDTVWEIEDKQNTEFSYANLEVGGALTMWSQHGGGQTLSLLAGRVDIGKFNAVSSSDKSTVNLRDGVLRIDTITNGKVTLNMLAGGDGHVLVGKIATSLHNAFYLNFERENRGKLIFLSKIKDGAIISAGGTWQYLIKNGQVRIDGVPVKDLNAFQIANEGIKTAIALAP